VFIFSVMYITGTYWRCLVEVMRAGAMCREADVFEYLFFYYMVYTHVKSLSTVISVDTQCILKTS